MNWLANDDNPEYHRRVTGPAIVQAISREGRSLVDTITVGVGSAGTITGVGETIKAWTNDVRIVAVASPAGTASRISATASCRAITTPMLWIM